MRLLDQEEAEIEESIKERNKNDGEDVGEDLKTALKVVKAKRVMLPSQRRQDGSAREEDPLPSYE